MNQPIYSSSVEYLKRDNQGFILRSGKFTVYYNQPEIEGSKNMIIIYTVETAIDSKNNGIATSIVNGTQLMPIHTTRDKKISYRDTMTEFQIEFLTKTTWGTIESRFIAYRTHPGLFRWFAYIVPEQQYLTIADNPPECAFYPNWHRIKKYCAQIGPASGLIYFYDRDMDVTALYFEDYTSLNDLYRLTGFENPFNSGPDTGWSEGAVTLPIWGHPEPYSVYFTKAPAPVPKEKIYQKYEIRDTSGRFGYQRPVRLTVPRGKKICINDAYLYLTSEFGTNSAAVCKKFVEMLAVVYQYIPKPPMETIDWANDIVPKLIESLNDPGNWSKPTNGVEYLTAYVKDRRGPYGELITQLEILVPLLHYLKKHPEQKTAQQIVSKLEKTIPTFWDDKLKTFSDGIAPVSSTQSGWYYFFPGMQMSDLAKLGNPDAIRMFQGTRDFYLKVGKQFNYQFAFFNWETGEEWHMYEYDVTGMFINLMMDYYDMSHGKDTECLEAAKKAAEVVAGLEFQYAYELNYTASGAVGLYRLYQVTGDERYRDLAYIPLANTLRWASLWECDYGVGEHIRTFWSFCPTPGNHCMAECENHHCRRYLKDFYRLASQDLTPEVKQLLSDSWKYGPMQSYYTMPPILIKSGAKWSLVKEGSEETGGDSRGLWSIDYSSYVPLEDAHMGWCREPNWNDKNPKNGTVGQEIYGAGGPIWYALWQDENLTKF
ncbi:MAG: hypothetical protein N3A72_08065 [bacterium]|nr:hypothetical protein [bacterium]